MTLSHRALYERYVHAGPISRDPDAVAGLFTDDGVFEAPLIPPGHPLPRRLEGREAIRAGMVAHQQHPAYRGTFDPERSRFVLHETADPDVFICEIDTVLRHDDGGRTTMSLVQIFRVRDDRIALMRDYFLPPGAG